MAENINFIPATDLPVAESEEVSILCLENGAMKQKPAKGLGGGVHMLKLAKEEILQEEGVFVITADCTEMVNALENGAVVMLLTPAETLAPVVFAPVVIAWGAFPSDENTILTGQCSDGDVFMFPNAPIPSFLQEK